MELFVKEKGKEKRRSCDNTPMDNQQCLKKNARFYSLQRRHSVGSNLHFESWKSRKEACQEHRRLEKRRSVESNLQEVPKILPYSRRLAEKQLENPDPIYRPITHINTHSEPVQEKKRSPFPIKNSLKRMNNCLPVKLDVNIKPMNVIVSSQNKKEEKYNRIKQGSYPTDFKRRLSLAYGSELPENSNQKTSGTQLKTKSPSFTRVSYSEGANPHLRDKLIPSVKG